MTWGQTQKPNQSLLSAALSVCTHVVSISVSVIKQLSFFNGEPLHLTTGTPPTGAAATPRTYPRDLRAEATVALLELLPKASSWHLQPIHYGKFGIWVLLQRSHSQWNYGRFIFFKHFIHTIWVKTGSNTLSCGLIHSEWLNNPLLLLGCVSCELQGIRETVRERNTLLFYFLCGHQGLLRGYVSLG